MNDISFDYPERIAALKAGNPFISQSDLVHSLLREDILKGLRIPGSRMIQDKIAEEMNVSRSPVRDALHALLDERLIISRGKKGFRVYIPTIKDAKAICEYRTAIETECGVLAARRHTEQDIRALRQNVEQLAACPTSDIMGLIENDIDFHDTLVSCGKNPLLTESYRSLDGFFQLYRIATVTGNMREAMVKRHTDIVNALQSRDLVHIRECILVHLEANAEDIVEIERYSYE